MITLRLVRPDEAARLAVFAEQTFRDTYARSNTPENMDDYVTKCFSEGCQLKELNDPTRRIWVAELGTEWLGYYMVIEADPSAVAVSQPALEISRFYVLASQHGSRLAHTMMKHLLETARADGFKTVWLGVWEQNARAIAFYKKWIFREIGSQIFKLGSDPQRDLVLSHGL